MKHSTAHEFAELYPVRLADQLNYEDLKDVIYRR